MVEQDFSLADIELLMKFDTDFRGIIQRKLAATKEIFVNQLYVDLDDAIQDLENNKHFYQDKKWGEDELTACIITFLKGRLYDVEHDTQHGGHVDILVKHQRGKFEWIGEAKLWDGPKYIHDGWIQLTERYGTGTCRDDHGGMLIYIKADKSAVKFNDWKNYLSANVDNVTLETEAIPLRFKSVSKHPATDLPYYVRHMGVSLYHYAGKKLEK
ncbi:hypothetical protein [Enterobacter cloacae]|uniref:hypothetical protein n=1 Tax=Enterobacter cloacae TaxID=550 RepID=UPI002075AF6C|nr:hypothetical protein [Enterobacter cloacae]MCM7493809.1 hypothetical protein [Enterobacter cloacae]